MSYIRETIRGKDEWTVYEQIGFAGQLYALQS